MNLIEFNFDEHIDDIIDAISEAIGQEFKPYIIERVKRRYEVHYINSNEIESYLKLLKNYKKLEFYKKFLLEIGEEIDESLTEEEKAEAIIKQINQYFSSTYAFDKTNMFYYQRLLSFKPLDNELKNGTMGNFIEGLKTRNQIEFLNLILGSGTVTTENYEQFKKTPKYHELKTLIDRYIAIFDKFMKEYESYCEQNISIYDNYLQSEKERKKKLNEKYILKVIDEIRETDNIPDEIKHIISEDLFEDELGEKSKIEFFTESDEEELKNPNTSISDKKIIVFNRLKVLKALGIEIEIPGIWGSNAILQTYEEVIKREEVKKIIPSIELVNLIKKIREKYLIELEKEFIFDEPSLEKYKKYFNSKESIEALIYFIKGRRIMVTRNDNEEHNMILLFASLESMFGAIDNIYIHELIHISETVNISDKEYSVGFEHFYNNHIEPNQYKKSKRKYEMFNETITDIFAMEASKILHSRGIYFAEQKDIIREDVSDIGTTNILKSLARPLLDRAKKEVVTGRMTGNFGELFDLIDIDNFEELNDAINKVHYLLEQGLREKLQKNDLNDSLVIQYQYELKRVEEIYERIDLSIESNKENKKGI